MVLALELVSVLELVSALGLVWGDENLLKQATFLM